MKTLYKLSPLCLAMFYHPAQAACEIENPQSTTVSWDPPTLYSDGKPFGFDEAHPLLDGYYIYYGHTQGGPYDEKIDVTSSTQTSYLLDCLEPDSTYYLAMTAYVPDATGPVESSYSGELTIQTGEGGGGGGGGPVGPIPNPPTGLTVSATERTAYTIVERDNNIVILDVGVVMDGTACDGSYNLNGLNLVPNDRVIWYNENTQPKAVWAVCSNSSE